jgi:hypothetical protein
MTRTNLTLICATLLCTLITASGCGSRRGGREPAPGTYGGALATDSKGETSDDASPLEPTTQYDADHGYVESSSSGPSDLESPTYQQHQSSPPPSSYSAPSSESAGDTLASSARRSSRPNAAMPYPKKESRPGLGTTWGANRTSYVHTTEFYRNDPSSPFGLLNIYYNNETGVRAQTSSSYPVRFDDNRSETAHGLVAVQVVDTTGDAFPGVHASGRDYVIGREGEYYSIRIRNRGQYRFEIVATVDGLDVVDGQAGSYSKRGYLLEPWATVEIDGFRRSDSTVAGFQFGQVAESYAARTGQARNVGVIGIAVFSERENEPSWDVEELERRRRADPFPNRYAAPPPY